MTSWHCAAPLASFYSCHLEIMSGLSKKAGLRLVRQEDVTANSALVAGRWHKARQRHKDELLLVEGEERFEGLQRVFAAVHQLTSERRLSRIAYLAEKPAG